MRGARAIAVISALSLGLAPPEPLKVGETAPPIVANNIDGGFDMPSYYRDFVLVTFWSLDDPASRHQFERLKAIRKELAGEGRLLVLSVCVTEGAGAWDRWRHFLEAQGKVDYGDRDRHGGPGPFDFYSDHKWVNAFLDTSNFDSSKAYGVTRAPDAFLIGPDRKLRAVHISSDNLRETVAKALKKKAK